MEEDSWERYEIRRRAELLFKGKDQDALDYANMMVESKQEMGKKEDQVYWSRIAREIELLIEESNQA